MVVGDITLPLHLQCGAVKIRKDIFMGFVLRPRLQKKDSSIPKDVAS